MPTSDLNTAPSFRFFYVCWIYKCFSMQPYNESDAHSGLSSLLPSQSSFQDSKFQSIPGYGIVPRLSSSQMVTPKLQTSDWMENVRSRRLSIAIHFSGKGHCKISYESIPVMPKWCPWTKWALSPPFSERSNHTFQRLTVLTDQSHQFLRSDPPSKEYFVLLDPHGRPKKRLATGI